ncbi:MAG: hypothetical protein ACI4EJ_07205 [Bacteroides sp.]|nr:stage III sporulation protein AG [Clostridia bacterium]
MEKEKLSLKSIKENILKNIGMKKCILIMIAGILLLFGSIPAKSEKEASTSLQTEKTAGSGENFSDYEEYIEKRLEKLLGNVAGVGKVNVMITFKETSEKVLVSEGEMSENTIKETDSSGGTRDTREYSTSKSYLLDKENGYESPYVVQEIKPQAEGVVVIAQGGSDPAVVTSITSAVEALLGVPVHKIQVLEMNK